MLPRTHHPSTGVLMRGSPSVPEHVGILICGSNEAQIKYAQWALLPLGADCRLETKGIENAISEWPLAGFAVVVIVDKQAPHCAQEFLMRCERTQYSPVVLCAGSERGEGVARLLDSGADDFVAYDALQDLGPTKIRVLLRRVRHRIEAGNERARSRSILQWPNAGRPMSAAVADDTHATVEPTRHPARRAS